MVIVPRSPLGAIQQALYERISGDAEIPDVYDYVPEKAAYPYVVIGESTNIPDNRHRGFGRETTHTLHVWSQYRGFGESTAIEDRIVELLDHQPMTLDGPWVVVAVVFEFAQTLREQDSGIRHVPVRFRVTTEQEK